MKLNKMLALALSGVMAVSMLAGCSGAPSNGEEGGSSSEVTVATDAAAAMNKAQSKVKFEADSTLSNVLAAAVEQAKLDDVVNTAKSATLDAKVMTGANSSNAQSIYNYMNSKLPSEYGVQDEKFTYSNASAVAGDDKEVTQTVIYTMKAGAYDEDTAVAMVAKQMNSASFKDTYTISGSTNHDYKVEYTGAVSVDTATVTKDGDTYSIYVVAVSVTRTPTEVNK